MEDNTIHVELTVKQARSVWLELVHHVNETSIRVAECDAMGYSAEYKAECVASKEAAQNTLAMFEDAYVWAQVKAGLEFEEEYRLIG